MSVRVFFSWLALLWAIPAVARADFVVLRGGGRVAGQILSAPTADEPAHPVTLRTLSGSTITLPAEDVDRLERRKLIHEEYERRAATTPAEVAAQLNLAEWCRQQGLSAERVIHLRQVLKLDPEHLGTRKILGYVRHGGEWMTQDQIQQSKGLVKHKGKWILPQELALLEQATAETEAEKQWYKPVRMWYGWINSNDAARQNEGLQKLRGLRDGSATAAIVRTFQKARTEPLRLLLADLLSRLESSRAMDALVELSLFDDYSAVREASLRSIRERGVGGALGVYGRALRHQNNRIVNRAGTALGLLGDDSVIVPLIEALVTRHKYKVQVPQNAVGVTQDGRWIQAIDPSTLPPEVAGMLATGQLPNGVIMDYHPDSAAKPRMKMVVLQYDEKNLAVLEALTQLTGENFGFDEQAWRRWRANQQSSATSANKKRAS